MAGYHFHSSQDLRALVTIKSTTDYDIPKCRENAIRVSEIVVAAGGDDRGTGTQCEFRFGGYESVWSATPNNERDQKLEARDANVSHPLTHETINHADVGSWESGVVHYEGRRAKAGGDSCAVGAGCARVGSGLPGINLNLEL